jgi:hypothetical protein
VWYAESVIKRGMLEEWLGLIVYNLVLMDVREVKLVGGDPKGIGL